MEAIIRADRLVFMAADGTTFKGRVLSAPKRRRQSPHENAAVREFLEISELGKVMRDGVDPPELLVPGSETALPHRRRAQ